MLCNSIILVKGFTERERGTIGVLLNEFVFYDDDELSGIKVVVTTVVVKTVVTMVTV